MAKLTILIALVAALVLVVHTSASRDERSCKRQLQQVNLRHCERHVMKMIQQQQKEEEEEGHFRRIRNVLRRSQSSEESEELDQCCDQLNEMNSKRCQCRALQQIFENKWEMLEGKEQEKQMERELMKLPMACGFGPLNRCDVNPNDEE